MFNRRKALALILSFVTAASVLSACSEEKSVSGTAAASAARSAVSSAVQSSSEPESSSQTSSQEQAITETPESGVSSAPPTSDAGFNKKWAENPLDKACSEELDTADTTLKIVKVFSSYSDKWETQAASAYDRLMTVSGNDSELKDEQLKWVNGKAEALEKIKNSVKDGGSSANITISKKIMDFYRSRAQQLYFEIYKYDKNFAFSK